MSDHEGTGTPLVPQKHRNLPVRILRALDHALHLLGLALGPRIVLAELCRFVPQHRPFDSIFAFKETIAKRMGISIRTVYRHLATLLEHELIVTQDQERRSGNGRFAVSRSHLAEKAAALVTLIKLPEEPPLIAPGDGPMHPGADKPRPAENMLAPSCANPVHDAGPDAVETPAAAPLVHSPPTANLTRRHTLTEPTSSKTHPRAPTENGLPVDLAWMTGNGLSRAGIFKLMRMATVRGKWLSDIVSVVDETIRNIKGGALFAYLEKLICGPSDFSVRAKEKQKRLQEELQASVMRQKAAVFRLRFRNTSFTNRKQNRLYVFDERSAFVQIFGGPHPTTSPLNDLREWIERVETGNLVLATLETSRRLQAVAPLAPRRDVARHDSLKGRIGSLLA